MLQARERDGLPVPVGLCIAVMYPPIPTAERAAVPRGVSKHREGDVVGSESGTGQQEDDDDC